MLGIDVSKDTLDAALADASSRRIVWERRVANSAEGIRALLSRAPQGAPWVVEPTGRYSLLVVQQARRAGRMVLLAPPRQSKRYMESHNPRATTDRIAARSLAFFGLDRRLAEYPLKAEHVDEVDQLLNARRGISRAMSALQMRLQELPRARQRLSESVDGLRAQLRQIDKQIERSALASPLEPLVRRLRAMPGIGPLTSVAFASRLMSKNFARGAQWVAYCGMDVNIRQSGKRKGERGLTKQGDAELRRLGYVCAQAAVRAKGSPFAAQFERERAKGMTKTAAYCAVARKLLTVAWAIQHHGIEYSPEQVYLPPWERRKRELMPADPGTMSSTSAEDRATLGSDPSAGRGVTTRRTGGKHAGTPDAAAPSIPGDTSGSDTIATNPTHQHAHFHKDTAHSLDKET